MADYILSEENVQELFAYLEDQLDTCGCDHTLRNTKQWLKNNIFTDNLIDNLILNNFNYRHFYIFRLRRRDRSTSAPIQQDHLRFRLLYRWQSFL